MVCFAQFVYNVKFEELETFIENAQRYFPNLEWKITLNDMTISSKDVVSAISRLKPSAGDVIKFDTGRIWDQLSFVNALPKVDFSLIKVSDEDRALHSDVVHSIVRGYHDSGAEVAMFMDVTFPWTSANVVMALVNEIMPLDGFFCSLSSKLLWIKKKDSYNIMCVTQNRHPKEGDAPDSYTNCGPHLLFDMDDGFINEGIVPIEMHKAFDTWVRGGRKGPVLSVFVSSLQAMCADTCRKVGVHVPDVLNL